MDKQLTIDLADTLHLSPVDRYLFIVARLNKEGFRFAEIFDLFPAEVTLAEPFDVVLDGDKATFRQGSSN